MEVIDISVKISEELAVYPGDPTYRRNIIESADGLGSPELSFFHMSPHTGTHIDAPSHFFPGATNVGQIDLDRLIGDTLVVEHTDPTDIPVGLVEEQIKSNPDCRRILFKTDNSILWTRDSFQGSYVGISLEAAAFLVKAGIKLVGIDYVSVDSMGSVGMPVHRTLLAAGIPILEGLNFPQVSPGRYYLVCLPLNMASSDGAPARAVLFPSRGV